MPDNTPNRTSPKTAAAVSIPKVKGGRKTAALKAAPKATKAVPKAAAPKAAAPKRRPPPAHIRIPSTKARALAQQDESPDVPNSPPRVEEGPKDMDMSSEEGPEDVGMSGKEGLEEVDLTDISPTDMQARRSVESTTGGALASSGSGV
jgi:hypothetical protein